MGRLASEEGDAPFTLPESAVVAQLLHALESPRPRARYYVTVPTHALALLKRVLPGAVARRGAESGLRRGAARNRRRLTGACSHRRAASTLRRYAEATGTRQSGTAATLRG